MKAFYCFISAIIICVVVIALSLNSLYIKHLRGRVIIAQECADFAIQQKQSEEIIIAQEAQSSAQQGAPICQDDISGRLKIMLKQNSETYNQFIFITLSVYTNLGKYDEALDLLNSAAETLPQKAPTYLLRGITHLQNKDYENALKDFNTAEALNEEDYLSAYIFFNKGLAALYQGNYNLAYLNFTKASLKFDIGEKEYLLNSDDAVKGAAFASKAFSSTDKNGAIKEAEGLKTKFPKELR